jgi:ankyrin repeat protein
MPLKKALCLKIAFTALLLCAQAASAAPSKNFFGLCRTGSIEEIRAAIEAGADLNARQSNGETALYSAVSNPNPDVVSLLIEKGADVNARDRHDGKS